MQLLNMRFERPIKHAIFFPNTELTRLKYRISNFPYNTHRNIKRLSVARSALEQQPEWCWLEIFMSKKRMVPDTGSNPQPSD